tara:strand:+ start:66 stop:1247 length:1182 start_codon:yes stop_codon:yes gene_type:complete
MSDFRKPRADTPLVPQSALFRPVRKAPKKPKGRRGKKPKGKKVGNFVSRQDPNFILRKADEDARRAREQSQRQTQQQEVLIQAQIEDIRDRREDRAGQLQIEQDRFALGAAEGRENRRIQRDQLRLQGEENEITGRYRVAKLTQGANQGAARAAEAVRAQQDSMDIYTQLRQQHRLQERREGENREVMRDFLRESGRGGRRQNLDLSIGQERERETTDIEFAPRATSEQRRQRRQKVSPREREVIDSLSSSAEEVLPRARSVTPRPDREIKAPEPAPEPEPESQSFRPRILRGDPDPPQPFGDFTPDKEVGKYLSGQRKQPPVSTIAPLVFEGEELLRQAYHPNLQDEKIYRPIVGTYRQARDLSRPSLEPDLTDSQVDRDLRAMADRIKFSP